MANLLDFYNKDFSPKNVPSVIFIILLLSNCNNIFPFRINYISFPYSPLLNTISNGIYYFVLVYLNILYKICISNFLKNNILSIRSLLIYNNISLVIFVDKVLNESL